MDRSFPMLDYTRKIGLLVAVIIAIAIMIANVCILKFHGYSMFCSTYATMLILIIDILTLISYELYSKWNSFIIASGTDRTEFINSRFIKLTVFNVGVTALFTCMDIAYNGLNDKTIALILFNVSLALIATAVFLYIFCLLGATLRSNLQMGVICVPLFILIGVINGITMNLFESDTVDTSPYIWLLIVAMIITAVCYFACRRRIRRVDM